MTPESQGDMQGDVELPAIVQDMGQDLDGLRIPALLPASSVRDDTVSAAFVAAKYDVNPGCKIAVSSWNCHVLQDVDRINCQYLTAQIHLIQE